MVSFDVIWARITRVVSFMGGMGIMFYETVADHSDRPYLYAAAVGMMGLPLARIAEEALSKFSPGNNQLPQIPLMPPTTPPEQHHPPADHPANPERR